MIDRSQTIAALVETCPDFAPTYASFIAEWSDEPELPCYPLLGDFARYLISLVEADDHRQLNAAFELIETLHTDGDAYVREAATIGILEDLQNTYLHTKTTPAQIAPYLRPVSLEYWHKLYDFWGNSRNSPVD